MVYQNNKKKLTTFTTIKKDAKPVRFKFGYARILSNPTYPHCNKIITSNNLDEWSLVSFSPIFDSIADIAPEKGFEKPPRRCRCLPPTLPSDNSPDVTPAPLAFKTSSFFVFFTSPPPASLATRTFPPFDSPSSPPIFFTTPPTNPSTDFKNESIWLVHK